MADITWQVNTSAGSVEQSSPTLSDANMDRFVNWVWYAYPQLDADGDPLPRTAGREAAAVRDWMTKQWQGTKANVLNWERREAAQAASDGVGDIE